MNPFEALARGIGQFTGVLPGVNMPLNAGPIPMEGRDTRFLPNTDPYQRDYGMSRQARQDIKNYTTNRGMRPGIAGALVNTALGPVQDMLVDQVGRASSTLGIGRNTIPGQPPYYKSVGGTDFDIRTKSGLDAYKRAVAAEQSGSVDPGLVGTQDALSQGADVRLPGEGGGFFPTSQVTTQMEQAPTSRAELEQRAYQNEATRLMQQTDPYFRGGGAPMMSQMGYRDPAMEMAINQSLYGDQTTFSTPNPLMQGLNYNMSSPVGQEQSQAQMMADRFRNGMIEAQGASNFGMNPSDELISGMDPEMFRARLEAFQPGGPRRRSK
jgi:hypothetical protein